VRLGSSERGGQRVVVATGAVWPGLVNISLVGGLGLHRGLVGRLSGSLLVLSLTEAVLVIVMDLSMVNYQRTAGRHFRLHAQPTSLPHPAICKCRRTPVRSR
jgi:hypothetical protein